MNEKTMKVSSDQKNAAENNRILTISSRFMGSAETFKKELERRGYLCELLYHDRPPVGNNPFHLLF